MPSIIIAIFMTSIVVIFQNAVPSLQGSTSLTDQACVRHFEMLDDYIEANGDECSQDNREQENFYSPNFPELENIENVDSREQQFRIRYDESCQPGFEHPGGCEANPDLAPCSDGSFPYRQIIEYFGGPNDGNIDTIRLVCPEDEAFEDTVSPEQIVEEIRITPAQFRRFPIAASEPKSNPQEFSLRNGHTHFWATADNQTFNTDINGTQVAVRAIPVQWQWNYGDGATQGFSYPGEPAPDHTLHHETPTSHSYTETGIYSVNLTTLYRGEFSVSGGPWQPIAGQAAVPSTPIAIDVWRTKKQLIATENE